MELKQAIFDQAGEDEQDSLELKGKAAFNGVPLNAEEIVKFPDRLG